MRPVRSFGNQVYPVEGLVFRQAVQDLPSPGPNERLEAGQVARCEHGRNDLALLIVLGLVLHDEHGQVERWIRLLIDHYPAAESDATHA